MPEGRVRLESKGADDSKEIGAGEKLVQGKGNKPKPAPERCCAAWPCELGRARRLPSCGPRQTLPVSSASRQRPSAAPPIASLAGEGAAQGPARRRASAATLVPPAPAKAAGSLPWGMAFRARMRRWCKCAWCVRIVVLAGRQRNRQTECMHGHTDGMADGWTDEQTDGQTDGRTDGRADGQTDSQTDGRMDDLREGGGGACAGGGGGGGGDIRGMDRTLRWGVGGVLLQPGHGDAYRARHVRSHHKGELPHQ